MDTETTLHPPREIPDLPVLSVSQLTQAIKLSLEATFPLVCVQGEISNFKRQSSGHLYFSLKDNNAQIAAVMFRAEAARLRHVPKDGDQVVLKGELNVYPPRGNYQLIVRELHLAGIGELLLKLEELKGKLQQRGWFDLSIKKPLPKCPHRIGVVTSPTGAVIQDIIHVLTRRCAGFHLILNPVKVQGEGSAQEIAQAIHQFNQYDLVDVIIVARGGGSIEDLWAFNEEIVAEAIFKSHIPIISAVGHETDVTIADFVADVRAPTPSAAAEMAVAESSHQIRHLVQQRQRLDHTLQQLLRRYRQRLGDISRQPALSYPTYLLRAWMQRLDDLKQQIEQTVETKLVHKRLHLTSLNRQLYSLRPSTQIQNLKLKVVHFQQSVTQACLNLLTRCRRNLDVHEYYSRLDTGYNRQCSLRCERLKRLSTALSHSDPKALLSRGYSIVFSEADGSTIHSVSALPIGQRVKILVSDGARKATVTE